MVCNLLSDAFALPVDPLAGHLDEVVCKERELGALKGAVHSTPGQRLEVPQVVQRFSRRLPLAQPSLDPHTHNKQA